MVDYGSIILNIKPRLHEHMLTYIATLAQPVKAERGCSYVYMNASVRRLLAFFLNKQSCRRRSVFHRAYKRAASISLPWYSCFICKIVHTRSTYTLAWPGLARGRTRLPKPSWASTLSSWNRAQRDRCKHFSPR